MNDEMKLDYLMVYSALKADNRYPRPMIHLSPVPPNYIVMVNAIMEGRNNMTDEQAYADLGRDNKETTGWLYQMYKYR